MQADLTDEETARGLLNLLTETIARNRLSAIAAHSNAAGHPGESGKG
jgi:hypothetical protein